MKHEAIIICRFITMMHQAAALVSSSVTTATAYGPSVSAPALSMSLRIGGSIAGSALARFTCTQQAMHARTLGLAAKRWDRVGTARKPES